MTPDRVAAILRDLLQTPKHELGSFARRNGLTGDPNIADLERAQEIVRALSAALQSAPGPHWQRITDGYKAMIEKHGAVDLSALGPTPPQWLRNLPPKPTLGDPAPTAHRAVQPWQPPTPAPLPTPPPPPPPQPQPRAARTEPIPTFTEDIQQSVAKYAAFCAACAAFPDRIALTQREYGIANDFQRVNIDTLWQDRFDERPDLQREWERLFAHYRDALRRR